MVHVWMKKRCFTEIWQTSVPQIKQSPLTFSVYGDKAVDIWRLSGGIQRNVYAFQLFIAFKTMTASLDDIDA